MTSTKAQVLMRTTLELSLIPREKWYPFSSHAALGNALVTTVLRGLYGARVRDLGPFRAVRADVFRTLGMSEMTFGWPTEMTIACARRGHRIVEAYARLGTGQ